VRLDAASDDVRLRAREGAHMRRTDEEGESPSALGLFVEAVRALSFDPRPENVERYLLASTALDDSLEENAAPDRAA
jgi:hypothetical protein